MAEPVCPGCRALLQRIAELEAQVRELSQQLEQVLRAGKRQAAPFRKGPPQLQPKKPGRKAGDDYGTKAHRPPPPPEQIQECHEALLPDACPHCGSGQLEECAVVHQYQTEIPRQPVQRQFNIHVGTCGQCGRRVQGRHALQTSDALGAAASQLGPDAQAAIVALNKDAGLSHQKVSRVLDRLFGISVTPGGVTQVLERVAQRLTPVYEQIRVATRQSQVLTPDETGWRIGGQPAWLHAWVGTQSTCYAIDPRRSAAVLQELIGLDWQGLLIHDGFASYDRFTQALHQQCLAHVLRRLKALEAEARGGAVLLPRRVRELLQLALYERDRYRAGELSARALAATQADFVATLEMLTERPKTHAANERLAAHLWHHAAEWFTFLAHPEVAATNWQSEQALRPAVVNRKVWGGNRTPRGARVQAILMSVWRTCWQQGQQALDFVSRTLRGLGQDLFPKLPVPASALR